LAFYWLTEDKSSNPWGFCPLGLALLQDFERLNMNDKKYNGWTNYETWRVNLEIFDGFDPYDNFSDDQDNMQDNLAEYLKDYVETIIYESGGGDGNLAVDYALAFLQDVNWHEIAKHMIADYAEVTE
jgi:hypothetical protein